VRGTTEEAPAEHALSAESERAWRGVRARAVTTRVVAAAVAVAAVWAAWGGVVRPLTTRTVPVDYFARFACTGPTADLLFEARTASGDVVGSAVLLGHAGPPQGRYCAAEGALSVPKGTGPLSFSVALARTPDQRQRLETYSEDEMAAADFTGVGAHRGEQGPPGTVFVCPLVPATAAACTQDATGG
jgi:hypothetical protein